MSTRTFILHTPLDPDQLKFVKMSGKEALSGVSEFDLQCVSPSDEVDASALLGQSMTVEVIQQDGSSRYVNGIVTDFAYVGPQGSAGRRFLYEAKIRSWLWLCDKQSDCRIYQEQDVPSIIRAALQDFGMPFEIKTMDQYAKRVYTVQFQESTLNFVKRLAEEVGLYFYVRHELGLHTIVFTDGSHTTLPVYEKIPFLTPGLRILEQEENVSEWRVQHRVKSGRYASASYNFKAPGASLLQSDGVAKGHANDGLEMYEWSGAYVDRNDGADRARVRSEQQQLDFQTITATSNVRGIAPGFYFKLTDHPVRSNNAEYLIVNAEYHFQENSDSTGSHGEVTSWNVTFTAWSSKERYQPPRVTVKPKVTGPQTALVTGPSNSETWVNEFGQIKVHFYWDRYSNRDENSSCWIRVASSWAGANWGEVMVPRIGQEVIIEHLDGDADRPIAVGRVNNANQMPSSFSKTGGLPTNHTLAGIKSKEYQGNRYNQLLFDDTAGEIRAQLESEHAKSQLNLGYLSHPRNGSAEPRGEGVELRTDAWGAVRAAKGLLLSADARPTGDGNAMSREELIETLQHALDLAKSIGDLAEQHQGNATDHKLQKKLTQAVKDWGHGSNAEKGDNGGTPLLAVSAPAGIAFGTQENITVASDKHIDQVAQKNQHLTAGEKLNFHAGQGISHFAIAGGIKSIANTGKQLIQAQNDDIQITADQSVTITGTKENITLAAAKHITLASGGGYIKISGGNIEIHCPGTLDLKAGNYTQVGPASMPPTLPSLPVPIEFNPNPIGPFSLRFTTQGADDLVKNDVWPGEPFAIIDHDGKTLAKGTVPDDGRLPRVKSDDPQLLKLQLGDPQGAKLIPHPQEPLPMLDDSDSTDDQSASEHDSEVDENLGPDISGSKYFQEVAAATSHNFSSFLSDEIVAELIKG